MKINMGPYLNYIGPYQVADKILFFTSRETKENFGDWLSRIKVLNNFFVWLDKKRKRKIEIRVDKYDVWSMDQTLAHIIVPMLKKLRENSNHCCVVENKDVPKHLRKPIRYPVDDETLLANIAKWEWVLDEMIWAFEQHLNDDWQEIYFKGEVDFQFEKKDNELTTSLVPGPNHTFTIDKEGILAHRNRMLKGRMLFAKYYEHLWD